MIFSKFIKYIESLKNFVIADPSDNSITLSKRLFEHIKKNADGNDIPYVFVFRIAKSNTFGFMVNPEIKEETQLCQIQYNTKYKCIGFETLCPSVGRILYDYGLPDNHKIKLSVSIKQTVQGKIYYEFNTPVHGKRNR